MTIEAGETWLTAQLMAHESRPVTYSRGNGSAAVTADDVSAVVDKSAFRVDNGFGVFIRVESRDYLIAVSDLEAFTEPQRGDVILDTIGSHTERYEVMAPDGDDVCKYEDEARTLYRIYTKYNGRES